ncbi:piggyBac transposable element-derived protein 2-like isoform X1, partial [Aphis craccivora]
LPVSPLFTSRKQNNNIHHIHVAQQRERAGPLKWKKRKFIINEALVKFTDKPLPSKFTDLSTPLSFFNYFFDEKLYDLIVEQTNLFSNDNVFAFSLPYLHFNDNSTMLPKDHPDNDRLHKIRPVIDHLTHSRRITREARDTTMYNGDGTFSLLFSPGDE